MPAYVNRAFVAALSVVFVGTLPSCASLRESEPRSETVVARYTFTGSIPVSQTRLAENVSGFRTGRRFSGTILVHEDGRAKLSSTHGSCEGGRVVGDQVNITCGSLRVNVGPNGGMARVPVLERYEARSTSCAEYATRNEGGALTCLRYKTEERTRTSIESVALSASLRRQ